MSFSPVDMGFPLFDMADLEASNPEASDPEALDPEASSVKAKEIYGTVEQYEDFKTANGEMWRRNQEPLGEGGYSQVYLYKNGGSLWAVKRIANISGGGRTSSAELENEKAALIKFSDHERFVRFNGWFAHENIEYFALEYVQLGNLEDNLGKRNEDGLPLSEEEIKCILTQILEGVEFMHAERYIHRDLKPENILVAQKGPEWQVKITDLGLSKCTLGVREGYSFTGTPPYMAPEIYESFLDPSNYTNAIDIWAVGCIACRMLIGEPPFSDPWLLVQYLKAIRESKSMDQLCKEVPYISKDLAGVLDIKTLKGLFLRELLEPEPEERLNASRAKGHVWLQGYDFCALQGRALDVTQVAFSPNGKLLAWTSWGFTSAVILWSVEERKTKHILESLGLDVFITFWRDDTLVECEECTGVRVWDTGKGEVKNELRFPRFSKLACSSDGSSVAAILENGSIELRDTEKGGIKHVFPPTWKATPRSITLSSNGEVMAVGHSAGYTILRDTGKEYQERMLSIDSRSRVFFSPNNQIMALPNRQGIFLIWVETLFGDKHEQAWKWISGSSFILDRIYFSGDSKLAAVAGPFNIKLENTGQKRETRFLKGHSDHVTSVAFSPISPLLASASRDHTVILWDTEKGEKLCTLIAHSDRVRKVAFSPNGELVATASSGRVGLWNVSRWKNGKDQG